ncbi:cupin-like domain-containing protein [Saprospiraceae bacterium]|jgi:ribosomal protein L16 Arg81 hydroxylase|nr:cupin-like domain-containing protein [Bacteroidota bacterium]MDB4728534.1 cupin-like domain-containing protein [Saprospiraceae bacterium]MDF1864317.1 cupin-like domain-containing protein [Saprospiraceae bacterium]
MPLKLTDSIDRVEGITRKEFQENYMIPAKPVIIKNFYGKDAPLYTKWTFDWFKQELGHLDVGVFDIEGEKRKDDRSYKGSNNTMKFGDYLDLVQAGPTTRRLFLFNVFKYKKDLFNDFEFPDVADNVLKRLPFAFFGGEGGVTRIHRDMDNSNVFLTELYGRKRVVLFDPKYSTLLYRYPFGTHTSVDINNPDYDRYPGLHHVKGIDCYIEAGDTLFMPAGWWHHIEYHSAGMGFSMRSLSPHWSSRLRGLYQVGVLTHLDEAIRFFLKDNWHKMKTNMADKRALSKLTSV